MQSIYNQEILDKIKAVYSIELKNFIGWSIEDIAFLEKQIYPSESYLIDTQKYSSGIYFISVDVNERNLGIKKLIIVH